MKINPNTISAYRQIDSLAANQNRRTSNPETTSPEKQAAQTTIVAPSPRTGSSISVAPKTGTYADTLTDAERAAFDLVFKKYQSLQTAATAEPNDAQLGRLIDVKI